MSLSPGGWEKKDLEWSQMWSRNPGAQGVTSFWIYKKMGMREIDHTVNKKTRRNCVDGELIYQLGWRPF